MGIGQYTIVVCYLPAVIAVSTVSDLILLISITSAPLHVTLRRAARESWLIPCTSSRFCAYRFFIDIVESNVTTLLATESYTYDDLVFRGNWCRYMNERHHYSLNYGNHVANFTREGDKLWNKQGHGFRAMYKVDWKVCFTKWALVNDKMAAYHAYVEDDSFICVGNLLHQMTILERMNATNATSVRALRTGYALKDAFDDSSTLMSREVALAFAHHYLERGFDCPWWAVFKDPKSGARLSWGNSWMNKRCHWRKKLFDQFGLKINVPQLSNKYLKCRKPAMTAATAAVSSLATVSTTPSSRSNDTRTGGIQDELENRNSDGSSRRRLYAALPCPSVGGLITHHAHAGEYFANDPLVAHMCDYTFFVDKVKDENLMKSLWNVTASHTPVYLDFSPVLTHDGDEGWPLMRQALDAKEQSANTTK